VDEWLALRVLSVDMVPIIHSGDMRSEDTFVNDDQCKDWQTYHATHAELRMVSAEGNLIQGSRELRR